MKAIRYLTLGLLFLASIAFVAYPPAEAHATAMVGAPSRVNYNYEEAGVYVNPKNPLNIMVASVGSYGVVGSVLDSYSTDGGNTWSAGTADQSHTGINYTLNFDGTVDANGNFYVYNFMNLSLGKPGWSDTAQWVYKSTNGGATFNKVGSAFWTETKFLLPNGAYTNICKSLGGGLSMDEPKMVADRSSTSRFAGNLYYMTAAMMNVTSSSCTSYLSYEAFERSTDGGLTWTSPRAFNESQFGGYGGERWMGVTTNGTLIIASAAAGTSICSNGRGLTLLRSTDGGQSFSTVCAYNPSSPSATTPLPWGVREVATGYAGDVDITFLGCTSSCGTVPATFHLYSVFSIDNGVTFGPPVRIDDVLSPDNIQFPCQTITACDTAKWTTATLAPNGRIDVSWFDARNDGGNLTNQDVYYSYSNDSGTSFAQNLRITPTTFNGCCDPGNNNVFESIDSLTPNGTTVFIAYYGTYVVKVTQTPSQTVGGKVLPVDINRLLFPYALILVTIASAFSVYFLRLKRRRRDGSPARS